MPDTLGPISVRSQQRNGAMAEFGTEHQCPCSLRMHTLSLNGVAHCVQGAGTYLDMDMYAGDGCGRELAYDQFLQLVADQLRDAQGRGAALLGDCAIGNDTSIRP